MRMFWAIIAVLILFGVGAYGVSFARGRERAAREAEQALRDAQAAQIELERAAAERAEAHARAVEADRIATVDQAAESSRRAAEDRRKADEARLAAIAKSQEEELRSKLPNVPITVTPTPEPAVAAPAPTPAVESPAKPVTETPVTPPKPPAVTPPAANPRDDEKPANPSAIPTGIPEAIGGYEIEPAKFEIKPDGALLVDGKFVVRGLGTLESPYEIPWELLTSVEHLFDPREGKKKLPGRVAFLHDKHVRMSGFISFPIMVKQPRELLVMLNQWDGCCIGVPPTPYDAIEVALTKAVTGNNLLAIAGGVEGIFQVKPYVMGDWLVGLYMLDKSDFSPTEFGGPGGY